MPMICALTTQLNYSVATTAPQVGLKNLTLILLYSKDEYHIFIELIFFKLYLLYKPWEPSFGRGTLGGSVLLDETFC